MPIAQAAERIQFAADPNVVPEEFVGGTETELRCDPLDVADARTVVQHFAEPRQTPAVHEHHTIHELHAICLASLNHLLDFARIRSTRFLAHHVFAGLRGPHDPIAPQSRRERNIDGINIGIGQ